MSGESKEEYEKLMVEFNAWDVKYKEWAEAMQMVQEYCPSYQNNSVCISQDGLTYGCTISEGGGFPWGGPSSNNVWVFDINSDKITKYDQQDNLCLTYLANDGIAVSSTPVSFMAEPSNSFILKDGELIGMYDWMNSKVPEYASWMKQNMEFEYEGYDEEWNLQLYKEFMTGHATSNPDLSIMALSVQNIGFIEDPEVWENPDYEPVIGYGYIFNINGSNAVDTLSPVATEKSIYDLSGRRLKNVSAPGIYIIDGKKKVIR